MRRTCGGRVARGGSGGRGPSQPFPTPATPASSSVTKKQICSRPQTGIEGTKYSVIANHFPVEVNMNDISHYEVEISPEDISMKERRDVVSQLFRQKRSQLANRIPIYSGNQDLYTAGPLPFESKEFQFFIMQHNRPQTYKITIEAASNPNMWALRQDLERGHDLPREAIEVLDTVLKTTLFKSYLFDKRSFFTRELVPVEEVVAGIEYRRGFHQSLRPTQMGLSLNIDISAGGFYKSILVSDYVSKYITSNISVPLSEEDLKKVSKSFKGMSVSATCLGSDQKYKIYEISNKPLSQQSFTPQNEVNETTVIQYYQDQYEVELNLTALPVLVALSKSSPIYLPMEICTIVEGNRYSGGLDEKQETALLEATVLHPSKRESIIKTIVESNAYNSDRIANAEFGIHVENELASVDARILPAPMLKCRDNTGEEIRANPSSGQWDMSNKKMFEGGKVKFWTCVSFSTVDSTQFLQKLVDKCNSKGMEFNPLPVFPIKSANPDQIERALTDVHKKNIAEGILLQLLIIILPDAKGSYGKIKRVCEIDLGIVSQCCRPEEVSKLKPEYFENIVMKINVKVGGKNTVLDNKEIKSIPCVYDSPTIIIGADVTHPGKKTSPSIAAVVATMDWPDFTKYRGSISAQPHNQEIIRDLYTTEDGQEGGMIMELFEAFEKSNGCLPERIIFYRDGVGEDQFNQVLEDEVGNIREASFQACSKFNVKSIPPITFIVVQKRHNTRLFPADNKNPDLNDGISGNILPGTVVDTVICHSKEFDFYLNSHAGQKGTNRPIHYHVLLDENKFTADELQIFTNNLCYTYARCTRSVSIVPPVYYAHLLASRARHYIKGDDLPYSGSTSGRGGTRERNPVFKSLPSIKENVKEKSTEENRSSEPDVDGVREDTKVQVQNSTSPQRIVTSSSDSSSLGIREPVFERESLYRHIVVPIKSQKQISNNGGPCMPFEIEVVEAALLSRVQCLEQKLMDIEPRAQVLLEVLPNRLTANVLEQLCISKQALVELSSRAGVLRQMLLDLLEDPHEIRRMCIMGRNCTLRKGSDSVECSMSLEKQIAEEEEEEI
ncbi:hypothetical protein LWI28_007042 [Acer negundo]|uniref:Uncharacterized protein n=1 Tax=Acer negundo TaxID=4023 RepID=A0AAD5JJR0_ACENE|nr:hypothetical protein LWI28_007042 [Acer negundo]